jgi:SAM-dependent methyltransferase
MSWYKEWFEDPNYLKVYSHRDETEAAQVIDLVERIIKPEKNSKILDLACGNGRVTNEFARRGYSLTGIDLSEQLLDLAKVKSLSSGLKIDFILTDMRNLNFQNYFDIIINIFTSFGYFKSDLENEKVISQVYRSLKKDGWFVFDFLNSKYVIKNFEPENIIEIDNIRIHQKREIYLNRINKLITISKNGIERKYFESVRLYDKKDLEKLLNSNKFVIQNYFGDYEGNDFSEDSERLIIFSKK